MGGGARKDKPRIRVTRQVHLNPEYDSAYSSKQENLSLLVTSDWNSMNIDSPHHRRRISEKLSRMIE